jgi:hypothetical protein
MRLRWLAPLCALLLAACGAEPDDPETRLRSTIASAEQAVEDRSLKQVAAFIAADYRDDRGHDRRAISQLLFAYLQRNRNIHLLSRITELQLDGAANSADVRLYVAMAGSPIASLDEVTALRAELYRFDLRFTDGEHGWQLQRADWRRARFDELLP